MRKNKYEPAGILCRKCGGSMFPAGLYRGGYIIGGVKCVMCGVYTHHLIFGGYKSYPHKKRRNKMSKKKNEQKSKGKVAVALLLLARCFAVSAFAVGRGIGQNKGVNLPRDVFVL